MQKHDVCTSLNSHSTHNSPATTQENAHLTFTSFFGLGTCTLQSTNKSFICVSETLEFNQKKTSLGLRHPLTSQTRCHECQVDRQSDNPQICCIKDGTAFLPEDSVHVTSSTVCRLLSSTNDSHFPLDVFTTMTYNHLKHQLSQVLCLPAGYHGRVTGTDCSISATCSCIRQRIVFHAEESELGVKLCQMALTKTNLGCSMINVLGVVPCCLQAQALRCFFMSNHRTLVNSLVCQSIVNMSL